MGCFQLFRQSLTLNAFEFFSAQALSHVVAKGLQRPFAADPPYYVLVEFEKSTETAMATALEAFSHCAEQGWVVDGVLSQSESQARDLWRLREDITEAIARYTPYKNDIAVRISRVTAFLEEINTLLSREYPDFEVIWFGHIGDGNLHISVLKPPTLDTQTFITKCQTVTELLFRIIGKYEGSISAEHGVGLTKKPYLHYTRDAREVAYLRAVKQVFDPNNILNPGKIFD